MSKWSHHAEVYMRPTRVLMATALALATGLGACLEAGPVTAPADANAPEPADANAPEPADANAPEPAGANAPEPADANAPEPADTTAPEPTDTTAPALTPGGLRADGAIVIRRRAP